MPLPLAELVAPNLHVALIHYPLGLLVVGVVIELLAFLWPRSTVRSAGRWMILLGALGGIPAAFSGIYALRQVARVDMTVTGRSWADVKAASPVLSDPAIWHQLKDHTLYQSVSTGVAVLAVVTWLGCGDAARRSLRWPVLVLLAGSVGGMMAGAWLGGEAIYKHGTGVDRGWPDNPANTERDGPQFSKVEAWFPPVELHVIAAGTAVALSLAAVGLSFRKLAVLGGDGTLPAEPDYHGSGDVARSFNPDVAVAIRPAVPASRAWLVAFLVAAVTSLGGWFVLFRGASVWETTGHQWGKVPAELWHQVASRDRKTGRLEVGRQFYHVVAGGTIIALPLLAALLAKVAPRQRAVLGAVTGLLVAAVAFQVWLGVLLLYDGPTGSLNRWNPPETDAAPPAMPTPAATTAPSV